MRFSVVVPARNEVARLPALLHALREQRLAPFEVIVVDNASRDGTGDAARAIGARVVTCRRPGVAFARQAGLEAATGDWIASTDAEKAEFAKKRIEQITAEVEVGKVYEGPITKILDFGALVNLMPGKDGLLHISQIAHQRVEKVTDYLQEGQIVRVKVLETDEKGRVKLSMKALLDRDQQQPMAHHD